MSYQIGDVSKITRISIKTLRYYHEIDLLRPSSIDSNSGYRYYDDVCIQKLRRIKALKELDFSLKEIKNILHNYDEDSDLTYHIGQKLEETKMKIKDLKLKQKKLQNILLNQRNTNVKYSDMITVKNVPDILVAYIKANDEYGNIGIYLGKIMKEYSYHLCGRPFTLYYDNEYSEGNVEMDICIPVKKILSDSLVQTKVLKGGQVLSSYHAGAYNNIGTAYQLLIDYINKNELKISSPTREIYIKGPGIIFSGNPKKYITEVQIMMM